MPTNAEQAGADEPTSTATTARTDLTSLARLGIGVVAFAAAVLSFSALRQLAISCQTWGLLAPLFPVSLDAAAAFGTLIWLRAERPEVVRLARRLTFAAIGLSILGNGARHGLEAAHMDPPWWAAVLVGAVAPAVFGAVIHLAVTATQQTRPAVAASVETPTATVEPETKRAEPPEQPIPQGPIHGPLTLEDAIHEAMARPNRPAERALADELGVTRHRLRTLLDELGYKPTKLEAVA